MGRGWLSSTAFAAVGACAVCILSTSGPVWAQPTDRPATATAPAPYDPAIIEAVLAAGKASSAKAGANLVADPDSVANLVAFYSKLQRLGLIDASVTLPKASTLPPNKRDESYLRSLSKALTTRPFIWLPDRELKKQEYPEAVVLLEYSVSPNGQVSLHGKCTGTVISPNVVLSAAHCVCEMTRSVAAHVGTANWMLDAGTRLEVASRHSMLPDCTAYRAGSIEAQREILRKNGDVAIFVVKEDITKLGIQPARVVDGFKPGNSYYIAGYGISDAAREGPRRGATIQGLLCDQARAVSYGCNPEFEFWGDGGKVTGREDRPDACGGDSGGPVFDPAAAKPVAVVGVISRPINGTSCGQGGIYVALTGRVLSWVMVATGLAASAIESQPLGTLKTPALRAGTLAGPLIGNNTKVVDQCCAL